MYASPSSIHFGQRPLLGCLLLLFSLTGAPAHAETINCTPLTALPATISTQGLWCLTGDLTTAQTSGSAITITANNVTLDLNGWKLGGQAAGPGTLATGIASSAANVTIKNGIVRGFQIGINLAGRGSVVEGVLVDQNTERGILIQGPFSVARNNQIVDTGGSTVTINAFGIQASGNSTLIEKNVIAGLAARINGAERGIYASGNRSVVVNNFITDTAKPTGGGSSHGIYLTGSFNNVDKNTLSNFNICIAYVGSGTGIYTRNTVTNCDMNYSNGTDGGGNAP